MAAPQLPWELMLQIVEATLPSRDPELIYDVATEGAQTLVNLCLVCRATYALATRLLRQHCIYINSGDRLRRLLNSIEAAASPEVQTLPATLQLTQIRTMYLAPFTRTLDDHPTAMWTRELLGKLSGSLRRLVVDFPFDTLHPWDDHLDVRRVLRQALVLPLELEELVDFSSSPVAFALTVTARLAASEPPPWPKLKRLALFNFPLSRTIVWRGAAGLRTVEQVVLVQSSGWNESWADDDEGWNVKKLVCKDWWTKRAHDQGPWESRLGGHPSFARPLRITFADLRGVSREFDTSGWGEYDPEGLLGVYTYDMREEDIPVDAMYPSRAWATRAVLRCSHDAEGRGCALPPSLWDLGEGSKSVPE